MHKEDFFRSKTSDLTVSQKMYLEDVYERVLNVFALDIDGTHGVRHWRRVLDYGTEIAQQTGADLYLVQLFAVLHDSCRLDEWKDWQHGLRAASYSSELLSRADNHCLSVHQTALLMTAIAGHTGAEPQTCSPDLTVGVCWDADRLDLGRIGCTPDVDRLFTVNSHHMIEDCVERTALEEYRSDTNIVWDLSDMV